MSLAGALESAAEALPALADAVRPANGDPERLLAALADADASMLLAWLLANQPEAGEDLALAWAESPRGAAPLAAIAEEGLPKRGRKGLRRARHRLRSRGVELPEAAPMTRLAVLPKLADELATALVSAPDPSGAQLVVIVESNPAGGARLFQSVVDLGRGILEFQVLQANRSQARRLARDLESQAGLAAAHASREALSALLARAAAAQPPDRALPAAFEEWRSRVARPPGGTPTPGDEVRAALGGAADLAAAREVAARVAAGRLGPWPPSLEALRAIAEKVRQAAESPLLVDDAQRRAQVEAVVGDALEGRFAGPVGEQTSQRLEEAAYVEWRRGNEADARPLLAAAAVFRERSPRDNPVARALLERVLGPMLEHLREERAASLLVRP